MCLFLCPSVHAVEYCSTAMISQSMVIYSIYMHTAGVYGLLIIVCKCTISAGLQIVYGIQIYLFKNGTYFLSFCALGCSVSSHFNFKLCSAQRVTEVIAYQTTFNEETMVTSDLQFRSDPNLF